MNPVLKGYFFEKRLRLLLRLVLMMCYYINNVEKKQFLKNQMLIAYLSKSGLHSSDRFLYNYMINLLLYWQSILDEWLYNRAWCISCACVRVCVVLFFVPTDIQKSNNVKLVQSSVPLGPHESDAFALPPLLDVVTVIDTAFAMPVCFDRAPRFTVRCFETQSLKSLPLFR